MLLVVKFTSFSLCINAVNRQILIELLILLTLLRGQKTKCVICSNSLNSVD